MSVEERHIPSPAAGANPVNTATYPSPHANPKVARYLARLPDAYVNSLCGALAGAASGVVTCPLDVIKTKLQAQGGFRQRGNGSIAGNTTEATYRGMTGTARTILRQDGLRGFYRGLEPMLIGYLPTWAVYMGVYGAAKDYFYTEIDNKTVAQAAASVAAGSCSTLATNPIWVVKTRLMSQVSSTAAKDARTPWHYKNTLDAFRQMYRSEGIAAFYSGLAPALLGLSHVAIQFPLYEFFKLRLTGHEMGEVNTSQSHSVGILAATFLSKVCATTATYPHEVLRTRMQTQQRVVITRRSNGPLRSHGADMREVAAASEEVAATVPKYRGVISACRVILAEEGWRAFYYGMGTNLFRAVPSAMTTMFTFETLKRYVQQIQEEGRSELVSHKDRNY